MNVTLATKITMVRIALIPFVIWTTALGPSDHRWYVVAFCLFLVGALSDWLDGWIARRRNEITNLGKFLDQLADKAFLTGVLCAFVWNQQVSYWLLAVIVIRDIAVSGARMLYAAQGTVVAAHWLGKAKTALQMGYVLLLYWSLMTGWPNQTVLWVCAWIVGLITIVSAFSYFRDIRKVLT